MWTVVYPILDCPSAEFTCHASVKTFVLLLPLQNAFRAKLPPNRKKELPASPNSAPAAKSVMFLSWSIFSFPCFSDLLLLFFPFCFLTFSLTNLWSYGIYFLIFLFLMFFSLFIQCMFFCFCDLYFYSCLLLVFYLFFYFFGSLHVHSLWFFNSVTRMFLN